jgi:hypothetical protein
MARLSTRHLHCGGYQLNALARQVIASGGLAVTSWDARADIDDGRNAAVAAEPPVRPSPVVLD